MAKIRATIQMDEKLKIEGVDYLSLGLFRLTWRSASSLSGTSKGAESL